jgi:2-succinyl-6-hydroxy-2,4-cyclohexadiene-1-carboxylate synthase
MQVNVRSKKYQVNVHQHRDDLPLLVMLHGFMGSGDVFSHLIESVKKFANPVTVDLLGHGSTEGDENPNRFQVKEQAADLYAVIQSFHPDSVILHGYSMGGRLALHYALQYSKSIHALILESTTYGITGDHNREKRCLLDEQRARDIESNFDEFLENWTKSPLFNTGADTPNVPAGHYHCLQKGQRATFMANSLRGFGSGTMPSVRHELHKLTLPVLILAGESDEKYRSIAAEMEQLIPNSRARIIENSGHRVHLENPKAFVSEVRFFIENITVK